MTNKFDLKKLQEDELNNFRDLFNLIYPKLLALSTRYVSYDVGEDLVQDVLLSYWEKREKIAADNIQSYLFKWLQNKCLNYLKHEKVKETSHFLIAKARARYMNEYLEDNEIISNIHSKELMNQVDVAVTNLPSRTAQAFRLCYFKDLSHKEVAKVMNISVRTVETYIRQAVLHLRIKLPTISPLLFILIQLY